MGKHDWLKAMPGESRAATDQVRAAIEDDIRGWDDKQLVEWLIVAMETSNRLTRIVMNTEDQLVDIARCLASLAVVYLDTKIKERIDADMEEE